MEWDSSAKMLAFQGPSIQNTILSQIKKVKNLNTNINKITILDIKKFFALLLNGSLKAKRGHILQFRFQTIP